MSGVAFSASAEEATAPLDEVRGLLPFVPTARRSFASTETVSAFVQVSQGLDRTDPTQAVTLRISIRDAGDVPVADGSVVLGPDTFATRRTATSRLTLPIAGLPPGAYLLSFDATMDGAAVRRTVRIGPSIRASGDPVLPSSST